MVGFEWQSFSFLETEVINFRENIGLKFFRKKSEVLQNKQCFNFFWDDLILRIATSFFFLFVGVFAFIFIFYFVFGELLPNLWNLFISKFYPHKVF